MKKIAILASIMCLSIAVIESASATVTGFYGGGGLGISRLDAKDRSLFNNSGWNSIEYSAHHGGLGWKLFSGYNFNEFIGLEFGYMAYGDVRYSSTVSNGPARIAASSKNSLNAINLVAKVHLPIGDTGFGIYGLGGGARVSSHVRTMTGIYSTSSDQNKYRPIYGAGVGYTFTEHLSTNLELSRIQGDKQRALLRAVPHADSLTLNMVFHIN